MNPLSIAYLCADRGIPVGGTKGGSIHVRGVAEALSRRGHRLRILAARVEPAADALSVPVFRVGFDRALKDVRQSIASVAEGAQLAREFHGLMLNEGVGRALREMHDHSAIDAIYERYSLWSWAGFRFAQEQRVPWVLEVNAPLVSEQRTYRGMHLEPFATGIQDLLLREADAIVVPAEELRDFIRDRTGRDRGISVLPNGVDLGAFDAAAPVPAEVSKALENRFVVAFSGSLKPWHGIDRLLRAFEKMQCRVPEAHLLVLGDGPLGVEIEEAVNRLGTDRITWTGAIPHEQVPSWLAHADVGVAPYPVLDDFYFSPLKIVEYLAIGLPVVASEIGQTRELVQHGETGLLVPPGKSQELMEALEHLHRNPRLRRRMGRRARERARRQHDWARVAERIEGLIERRLTPERQR